MLTKVFQSGNSQAVRIPKAYQLADNEVEIVKRGNELVIRPIKKQDASILFDILTRFAGTIQREDIRLEVREWS